MEVCMWWHTNGDTPWEHLVRLFCTSSLVEMFGQYRSGPVNLCVCAGSCQIVKCFFPRVETIFRDKVLRCLFSESVSAELPFPHAAAWFSGVFLGLGWLQAGWISSFLTWDPFLGFIPSSSYSFLTFMLHLHHLLLQAQLPLFFHLFCTDFPPPFPSVIVPFCGSLLPAFLCSVWRLLLFCFLCGAFCPCFSALEWEHLCFSSLSYFAAWLLLISCSLGSWQLALPVVTSFLAQRQSSLENKVRLGRIWLGRNKTDEKQWELSILGIQAWRRSSEMSDSSHDGAVLWLGGTSTTGSFTCLRNTEAKTQETRVLLNIASATITLPLASVLLC